MSDRSRIAPRLAQAAALCMALLGATAARGEVVQIPLPDGNTLQAHWLPAPGAAGPRPTVVALHGCGGLYRRDGRTLDARYPDYAQRLHAEGWHVLLPDSFGSRGEGSQCTRKASERSIKVATRRGDVAAAVAWSAARPEVDVRRIALLGWSNGGSTTLAAVDTTRPGAAAPLAGAVAFYPGCEVALKQGWASGVPLLMLLGGDDDWTPPGPCTQWASTLRKVRPEADLRVVVYPGAVHGFDGAAPVRLRTDVPNGVDARGVHVGGQAAARTDSMLEVATFLKRIFSATP
jgi:dienelactone hydrolase